MKKRSCSSHSEKSSDGPCFAKEKKLITFDYNHLACFIATNSTNLKTQTSRPLKKEKKMKTNPSPLAQSSMTERTNTFAALKVPRKNRGKIITNSKNAFNNSLLLLEYEGEEDVKPESRGEQQERKKQSPHSEEEDQQVAAIVDRCMRVITEEETEHSSNPISARYTPHTGSTPTNMQIHMTMPMMPIMPTMPQEYYYYYMKPQPMRNRRAISNEQSNAYVINLQAVETDGRTTIMVRDIPNKYTQDMLLELFEQNHKKKFDFFYLPIDYNNNCNVGYAFLNFIHTKFIKDFYQEFHLKKWGKFNSLKKCRVCYARIQGTAQLQHHFEHSNVLQQREKRYRPLIGLRSFQENISSLVQKQKDQHAPESYQS